MKLKIAKAVALVLAMVCLFCFPVPASAASQGTDGTELEVIQPQNLEIQLGESWAGVEFELKTDAGMYPGVITVGEEGVLRLEIGGSENYILSCLNSTVEIPLPGETVPVEEGSEATVDPSEEALPSEELDPMDETGEASIDSTEEIPAESAEGSIAGIPVKHIAIFGGGLVLAIGALAGINIYQKRNGKTAGSDEDDDEI